MHETDTQQDAQQDTQTPTTPKAPKTPEARGATLLHLSDLHFGLQFVPEKWAEIALMARQAGPDLVIVTGDLVETPWRWRLKTARAALNRLRDELRECCDKPELQILSIPGNHDTRVQGVLPVAWLLPLVAVFLGLASLLAWHLGGIMALWPFARPPAAVQVPSPTWAWVLPTILLWSFVALSVLGLVVRLCVTRDLQKALGSDLLITEPKVLPEIGIGLVPFDSASHSLSWARGRVLRKELLACKAAMDNAAATPAEGRPEPFWLALVHHHPLPLPYDDQFEQMMVMDNAGAFLNELALRRIRLVLHGHKHHQHFARITVDPATTERVEVAVLSAGTPTRGRRSMVHRHGFNVLRIDADHRVHIRMFEAEGDGSFNQKNSFDMVPPEDQSKWRFGLQKSRLGLSCRRMVCAATINDYGDAEFVREFRGVKTSKPSVRAFKNPLPGRSASGFVEAFRTESLSSHGPGVQIKAQRLAVNHMEAMVQFKQSGLQADHDPIDFLVEFQSNNAFALDRWQFSQMYPGRDDFTEDIQFVMADDIATEELVMHVRFAPGIPLPARIDLKWKPRDADGDDGWHQLPSAMIVRMERQAVVQVRIDHPRPAAVYQINWDLDDTPSDTAPGAALALLRRRQLAELLVVPSGLAALLAPSRAREGLLEMVKGTVDEVREQLEVDPSVTLHAALFAYDAGTQSLKCLASTYPAQDPRRESAFRYGLGIAGRAFKASGTVTFVKPHDDIRMPPTGYVCGNGQPAGSLADIREEAIIAFALAPLDAPDWPYAVLQISCDEPDTAMTTAAQRGDQSLEVVAQGLCESFTPALPHIIG